MRVWVHVRSQTKSDCLRCSWRMPSRTAERDGGSQYIVVIKGARDDRRTAFERYRRRFCVLQDNNSSGSGGMSGQVERREEGTHGDGRGE